MKVLKVEFMTVTAPSNDPTTDVYVKVPVVRLDSLQEWLRNTKTFNDNPASHYQAGRRDVCEDLLEKLDESK